MIGNGVCVSLTIMFFTVLNQYLNQIFQDISSTRLIEIHIHYGCNTLVSRVLVLGPVTVREGLAIAMLYLLTELFDADLSAR